MPLQLINKNIKNNGGKKKMMIYDEIKVLTFVKENNLKVSTKDGLLITDAEGCIVFESDSKTKCFQQAIAWIEGNECENLF